MKPALPSSFRFPRALLTLAAASLVLAAAQGKQPSDISAPDKRREAVEQAVRLSKMLPPRALPAKMALPFSPPGFDQTDAEEQAAAALAAAKAGGAGKPGGARPPPTARQTLTEITSRIAPSGTISVGESPMLLFGKKFVKVGAHLVVTYKGAPYDLELVAIDHNTFTLRLNGEEITRPIQPGK